MRLLLVMMRVSHNDKNIDNAKERLYDNSDTMSV